MNFWTKTLSILLILCTLASLLVCFPAMAADGEGDEEEDNPKLDTKPYITDVYPNEEAKIAKMTKGITAYGHTMYYDPASGEVAVKNEETGRYLFTNPYNVSSAATSQGGKSTEAIKMKLLSQIILTYTENDKEAEMNSFKDAAIDHQIKVKNIRGGLRVEYTLGREEVRILVPRRETVERFEQYYLEPMQAANPSDASRFAAFYLKKDINDPKNTAKAVQQILLTLPICKQFPIYVIDPSATEQELLRMEKWVKQYTTVTFDFIEEGHQITEYEGSNKEPALFKLAIEYMLSEDGVDIRLAANNIRFDNSNYKLKNISLLPHMGAGQVTTEGKANKGYVFIPDGSGSVIQYADIAAKNVTLTDKLYGQDYAFHSITTTGNKEIMRIPVYGIYQYYPKTKYEMVEQEVVQDDGSVKTETVQVPVDVSYYSGFMAIITEGDSLANITVENGGATHNFVSVYTKFNPRPSDTYRLDSGISAGSNATWTVESKRKYTGNYRIKYIMLYGDDASYVGMAKKYREYLTKQGLLTPIAEESADIPLYLETLGAIDTTERILGVPVNVKTSLSSFADTIEMLKNFKDTANISNIKLKMTGWMNGGMRSTIPYKVDVEKVLGDDEGFIELVDYAKNNGVTLFPEFEFVNVTKDTMFDGFNPKHQSIKTVDNRSATYRKYSYLYQKFGTGQDYGGRGIFLSSRVAQTYYDKAFAEYSAFNVGGIAVSSLGELLSSDFYKEDPLNREDSKTYYTKLLAKIKEQNGNVLISGGNAYALPYATDIINVSLEDSRSIYSMTSVPFMGIVLHGNVNFSGSALNLAGDYTYTMLKTIENGAVPYFVLALENASELKTSNFSSYYSVRYAIWLKDIVETYTELNAVLKDVKKSYIVGHEFIDADCRIVKVTYDNGTVFYLNYTLNDYTVEELDDDGNVVNTIFVKSEGYVKTDANGKIVAES